MRYTRKKVIKTVYKDENDSDQGGDFSDSGSEAMISEESASSEEAVSSAEEFLNEPQKITKQAPKKQPKQRRKLPAAPKRNFASAFISKIKHYAAESDEEGETKEKLFTVKDLSEKDKLLPSVLNLSESDSSEDESSRASSSRQSLTVPSTSKISQVLDSNDDEIADYNMWASNKQEDSEEVAKRTFLELEKHKNEIEETKASIEKYKASRDNSKTVIDVKDLLAQGEEVSPQAKPAKITKSRKKKADSDSEIEDWEEVHDNKPIPRQGIQLVVDFPDGAARKSKTIDVEMMMRRKINRVKKEYQVYMHKVHVLCWIGHGNFICRVLNDQEVMAAALSLMPSKDAYPGERIDMKYVEQITTWFKDKLTLKQDKNEDKFKPKAPPLKYILLSQAKSRVVTTKKYLVFLFVSLLRALGLKCRVMFNFVTLPLKPPTSELCSLSTKQKESNIKTANVKKEEKSPSNTKSCKRKSTKSIPQVDGIYDSFSTDSSDFSDELDNIMQVDGTDDAPVKSRSTRASRTKQKVKSETEDVSPPKQVKRNSPKPESKSPKADELPVKRKIATRKSPAPEITESTSKDKNDKTTTNKSGTSTTKTSQGTGSKTDLNLSPRKTRNATSEGKTKTDAKPKQPAKKESKTVNKPVIKITDEAGTTNVTNVSSKYFEGQEKSSSNKKLSLTRNRSQTTTPTIASISDKNNTDNAKTKTRTRTAPGQSVETNKYFASEEISRKKAPKRQRVRTKTITKSAPGQSVETSKYFASEEISDKKAPNRQRREKVDVLEDAQRVSHKDLLRNTKPDKNDVTGDLVSLIKGRVREANAGPKKRSVKGKSSLDSDDDSDFLPEEQIKRDPDSEDDFKPTKISPKVPVKRKIDRRVLSSDDDLPKNRVDVWCEVFVEELEQWVSVDVLRAKVHCASEIYNRATHPVAYIVGWDNNNYLKDLTRRYVPSWNTVTRRLRAEPRWWTEAVRPWRGPGTARDREEDEGLDRMQLEAPLPKSIAEYKNHPLYALQRHLLKFEAIYPADAATLGFVRGEPVYARECVYTCRSRDTWLKDAKTVKLGETPYKVVKARPKWDKLSNRCITDLPLEVFGPWQVQDYEPPSAENGIVPRNAYGNVELFKECMLPKGTVHLQLPGLNKVAKKLHIDCAPAMTGFDFNGGFTHPVFDGFVVCSEFADIIAEAWHEEQEEQERRQTEKLEARVYGNWRRLIKGLFIKERLKMRYGFKEPSPVEKRQAKPPKLVVKKRGV